MLQLLGASVPQTPRFGPQLHRLDPPLWRGNRNLAELSWVQSRSTRTSDRVRPQSFWVILRTNRQLFKGIAFAIFTQLSGSINYANKLTWIIINVPRDRKINSSIIIVRRVTDELKLTGVPRQGGGYNCDSISIRMKIRPRYNDDLRYDRRPIILEVCGNEF